MNLQQLAEVPTNFVFGVMFPNQWDIFSWFLFLDACLRSDFKNLCLVLSSVFECLETPMKHLHSFSKYYFRQTFKSCVAHFQTLFPHFCKRTLAVLSGTFRDISPSSFALAPTFLLLTFHTALLDFWFIFVLWSAVYTWLWGEGRIPFDCHFRPIDAVVVSHHLIKDVEIGEAFSNLHNLAPLVEQVRCFNCLYLLSRFCWHFFSSLGTFLYTKNIYHSKSWFFCCVKLLAAYWIWGPKLQGEHGFHPQSSLQT